MKNLDIIKAAAKMGYSAFLHDIYRDEEIGNIVGIVKTKVLISASDSLDSFRLDEDDLDDDIAITSYLYVGHLFGEPEIPEGTRFRVKATGDILTFERNTVDRFEFLETTQMYDKSELEPVFE